MLKFDFRAESPIYFNPMQSRLMPGVALGLNRKFQIAP